LGDPFGDFAEAVYDRLWPVDINGVFAKFVSPTSFLKEYLDSVTELQKNPATRQVTHLLYHSKEPISLVSHSQGCIIVRNATFTMRLLGKGDWVSDHLAWVAAGSPLGVSEMMEVSPEPAKFHSPSHPQDPVAQLPVIGGGGGNFKELNVAKHDFMTIYVPDYIERDMIWPPQGELPEVGSVREIARDYLNLFPPFLVVFSLNS
jgi:hypothetical protein